MYLQNITLIIIVITCVISILAFSNEKLVNSLIFNPYLILKENQYYRLFTSGFIHADWSHLIFNMLSFYFFGRNVSFTFNEIFGPVVGPSLFVLLYLVGIAFSDFPSLIAHKNSRTFYSLGASGGVSSIIYASIMFYPLDKIYFFIIPFGIPGFVYGILYLIYCSYAPGNFQKNINHSAHLWGSIVGVVFTIIAYPPVVQSFIEQIASWKVF
ncbi:MAG: rhomboid family intramembrane serine protease [Bacteroidota bacterium]|nr:rhomboid family intramembrane serine protease [Bacteroidota bacterium]